jgi:hypothetical protein
LLPINPNTIQPSTSYQDPSIGQTSQVNTKENTNVGSVATQLDCHPITVTNGHKVKGRSFNDLAEFLQEAAADATHHVFSHEALISKRREIKKDAKQDDKKFDKKRKYGSFSTYKHSEQSHGYDTVFTKPHLKKIKAGYRRASFL